MEWTFEDAALALQNYYESYDDFVKWKERSKNIENELKLQKEEQNKNQAELEETLLRLKKLAAYQEKNADTSILEINRECEDALKALELEFDKKQKNLSQNKDTALKENDLLLADKLRQFSGDDVVDEEKLGEAEKQALAFERDRRSVIAESNERINVYQDGSTQERLDCRSQVEVWKKEQDDIYRKYAPEVDKYQNIIDGIHQKHQGGIRDCQINFENKISARDEEIGDIEAKKSYEIRCADEEIGGYKKEYKRVERQYNEQIRKAKIQKRPTTQLQTSKLSQLNKINEEIRKTTNRTNRKTGKLDQDIETAWNKHQKLIDKAEQALNQAIEKRDQELADPVREFDKYTGERDSQIELVQNRIDSRIMQSNQKIEQLNNSILEEEALQREHNQKVDRDIIQFAMSGDTCFDEMLHEDYAPFIALREKISIWKQQLVAIRKDRISESYKDEYQKQKDRLSAENYEELLKEISAAQGSHDQISVFAKYNEACVIASGIIGGFAAILMIILKFVLDSNSAFFALLLLAAAAVVCILAVKKANREFSDICGFIVLACEYQEFQSIRAHSAQVTQEKELAKLKEIGVRLYEHYYGRESAQKFHDEKDKDIRADYARDSELLQVEFQSEKDDMLRQRDKRLKGIRAEIQADREEHDNQTAEAENQKKKLQKRIGTFEKRISEISAEIEGMEQYLNDFEKNYKILDQRLNDATWMSLMSRTKGKLSEKLYVMQENEKDQYGHKKIFLLKHEKKPLVITYDISDIDAKNSSRQEETGKIIKSLLFDLLYSVYRMNSKDIYSQIIVDEVGASDDLKARSIKNAFNITEVAGRIDEVKSRIRSFAAQRESLAEKGTTIDRINEEKFMKQERPEVYNILYIVFKPDERKGRLDDDIRRLIPECDRYGFLPIFICEKEIWEAESDQEGNMYSELKGMLSNPVIVYDGRNYSNY